LVLKFYQHGLRSLVCNWLFFNCSKLKDVTSIINTEGINKKTNFEFSSLISQSCLTRRNFNLTPASFSIPTTLNSQQHCYVAVKIVISQSITLLSPSHAQTSGTLQSVWAGPPQWIISAWICINFKWILTKYVNWYTRKKSF